MSRTAVLLLLVAIAYIGLSNAALNCPPHEVHKLCGTKCEPRCGVKTPPNCIQECVPRCQCASGYLRNKHNRCVLPKDC